MSDKKGILSFDLSAPTIRHISAENIKEPDWENCKLNGFDVWDGEKWDFIRAENKGINQCKNRYSAT